MLNTMPACGARGRARPASAYTLVEILAVLAIFVMAAVAVTSAAAGALRVYARAREYSGAQTDLLLAIERFERDLRNAFVFEGIGFDGDRNSFSFPGIIRPRQREGQEPMPAVPGRVAYSLDPDGHRLVLYRTPYWDLPDAAGRPDAADALPLAEQVAGVVFSYYYYDPEVERNVWLDQWRRAQGVPLAVRIQLKSPADGSEQAMDLQRTIFIPIAAPWRG